jgi:hypothetical protein
MKNFLTLLFILTTLSVKAQFTIVGQLKDITNEDIHAATVMLLNTKDSTLVNFTTSDLRGNFAFRNIKKTDYILKISYIGYMPQEISIHPAEERELNLGVIFLKPIAHFLMEVVIREAKAPIFIKGDTVEYDATTFKVPPGSTIEDLLRRLPGIDVDASGNISTMGKDVKTVYVDGKAFFGNDPKTVTQNLDAASVSKVQVFTEKSEQEKITGVADGSQEKVMNVSLKDEYKKGYFGKATLGYGWGENAPHRWLAKGNFNWFTDKQQLSFIGYGNNLNENSYDWGDMQEFYGQSMQSRWSDNGNFGFGSTGRRGRTISHSYYSDGSGFSNNGGGGANYNYYHKKVKFNAGYFYSLNKTFSDVFSNRQTFLQDSTFWRIDTTHNENFRQNHSFSTRFEYDIDSNNSIIIKANFTYSPTERENSYTQLYQTSEFWDINLHSVDNKYENDRLNFDILTIYNHKFKKKGRNFAISAAYDLENGNNLENINNINEFFNAISPNEQIKFIVKNNKNTEENNVKSSLMYVEPLGKRFSLMGFYNFSNSLSINKNSSKDTENDIDVDSLWLNYKNNTLYNRVGTSVNYAHNGINLQLGGAFQSLILDGKSEIKPPSVDKQNFIYNNFIPYFSANLDLPKNFYVNASYSYNVSEPDISYLFPMPNLANTMYKVLGNPNLIPERYHGISTWLSYWNSAAMINFSLSGNANFYDNQIVYNQNTEFVNNQGYVTISKPENVSGGKGFYTSFWSSFPIVKTKLTMNISANGDISNSPVFINQIKNNTNTKSYGGRLGFNLTIGQKLSFTASANISQTFTQYSIQSDRDQNYINYSANLGGKWQVFKKTFLEANYRFSNYNNKKLEFNQNINMLNVSVRQVIGEKNQWELRLAAMDILNQNQTIRQTAAVNYIEYRTSPTLARYFLLTGAYNIKGFETKNNQRRGYWY